MSEDRPHPVPRQTADEPRNTGDQLRLAGFALAAGALVLFLLQNLQKAQIKFLWMEWETQMIWALIVSAAMGALGMFLVMWVDRRRQVRKAKAGRD